MNASTLLKRWHKKPPPAGILNAKTLAEENLKGFKARNMSKENDISLRTNCPQRIELPIYFNTPQWKEDIFSTNQLKEKAKATGNSSALNMSYQDSYNRLAAQKRLKDYSILSFACKRAGKTWDEGRAYYSTGVLYDNTGKYLLAVDYYKKFL